MKVYKRGMMYPEYSYILFDNNLNKLGETLLSKNYRGELYFINNKGIHIMNDSSKKVSFGVFNILIN